MANYRVTVRYAKALFELAKESDSAPRIYQELQDFGALLSENHELRDLLLQPLRTTSQRKTVLSGIAKHLGTSPMLLNFYSFLIDQRRMVDSKSIEDEYGRLLAADRGVTKADVISAGPLTDSQRDRLERALAIHAGSEVSVHVKVDSDLIGGVVAKVGDLLFDGSLRTQ